jgi:hypothetical protein
VNTASTHDPVTRSATRSVRPCHLDPDPTRYGPLKGDRVPGERVARPTTDRVRVSTPPGVGSPGVLVHDHRGGKMLNLFVLFISRLG